MGIYNKFILKPNERIVRIYRRFPIIDSGKYFLAAIFLLIPFFFLFPLLRWGTGGIVLGVLLFVAGLFLLIRTVYLWYHNVSILTNVRIVDLDQRGFFDRVVSQSTFEKIQDVSFRIKGFFPTLFRYGDLNIKTAWGSVDLRVPWIYRPDRAQQLMLDLQEEFLRAHPELDLELEK